MKLKAMLLVAGAAGALMAGPVAAGNSYAEMTGVEILAEQTGLTERQIAMIVGNRTSFAEYRIVWDRVHEQYREAGGPALYEHLQSAGYFDADRNRRIVANRRAAEAAALN